MQAMCANMSRAGKIFELHMLYVRFGKEAQCGHRQQGADNAVTGDPSAAQQPPSAKPWPLSPLSPVILPLPLKISISTASNAPLKPCPSSPSFVQPIPLSFSLSSAKASVAQQSFLTLVSCYSASSAFNFPFSSQSLSVIGFC